MTYNGNDNGTPTSSSLSNSIVANSMDGRITAHNLLPLCMTTFPDHDHSVVTGLGATTPPVVGNTPPQRNALATNGGHSVQSGDQPPTLSIHVFALLLASFGFTPQHVGRRLPYASE